MILKEAIVTNVIRAYYLNISMTIKVKSQRQNRRPVGSVKQPGPLPVQIIDENKSTTISIRTYQHDLQFGMGI
jgi:hypothetical protein